jgi:hypothetical protein
MAVRGQGGDDAQAMPRTVAPSRRHPSNSGEESVRSQIFWWVIALLNLLIALAVITGFDETLRTPYVHTSDLEADARSLVADGAATCPDDLRGTVGSSVDCSVAGADVPYMVVRATVTSVDGDYVAYDFHRVG